MSTALPPGWTAHQTPEGRWYFSHRAPDGAVHTQWTPPEGSQLAPMAPVPPAPNQYGQQAAPAGHAGATGSTGAPMQRKGAPLMSKQAARFVLRQATEFKLQEKAFSLSGDSFSVKRVDNGEAFFKVKGNALSLKDSKALQDASGNPIYKMTEALLTMRGRMNITDAATKQTVMTLRKKGFIPGFGTRTIQAWAGSSDEGDPYLEVKGDFFRKDFTIKEVATGTTLATVKRKSFSLSNIVLEKDTYVIRVEPGIDTALMVFFVVAADEQYRDDGNRKGLSSLL